MSRVFQLTIILVIMFVLNSCQQSGKSVQIENPLIAKVHAYELRQSDLDMVLSQNMSPADSNSVANAFIENWIRNQLWNHEAEKQIRDDNRISQLVDSYRTSLLAIEYESQILKETLDSSITQQIYAETYEQYKTQFVLDEQLLQGWFAKIPKSASNQTAFYKAWKQSDIEAVKSYCESQSGDCMLSDQRWHERADIEKLVPQRFISSDQIKKLSNYKKSDKQFNYYLKYSAYVDKNEVAPLDYIKDELKRVILHARKEKIIADLTEEMYEDKIQSNHIQVFTSPDK